MAILISSITILIINHLFFFYGYFGYDDMHYAKLSFRFLNGHIDLSDHYSYRWALLLLTSLSYFLIGVSDLSTAMPALLLSSGILGILYWRFHNSSFSLWVAVSLFFSIKWNLFYTDKLMPDIYVSFFLFAAWGIYHSLNKYKSNCSKGILLSCSLFLAFLSKGSVILIVPLLLYYFLTDWKKGNVAKWRYVILSGLILLVLYFLLIHLLTGHPFSRFHAIESNKYLNPCSYDQMPFSETWKRLTIGFAQLVWDEHLFVFLMIPIFALAYAVYIAKEDSQTISKIHFYSSTILILFLSINFMTISLNSYNPMCLNMRHFLFIIPIMAASCASIVDSLRLTNRIRIIVIFFLVISILPTIEHLLYSKSVEYKKHKADIIHLASKLSEKDIVIVSNQVMINLINFYSHFKHNDRLFTPNEIDVKLVSENCYLVSNWYTDFHSNSDMNQLKEELGAQYHSVEDSSSFLSPNQNVSLWRISMKE